MVREYPHDPDERCILPLMHKVSHPVYIVALAISNICSMVYEHLMPHHPNRPYSYAF